MRTAPMFQTTIRVVAFAAMAFVVRHAVASDIVKHDDPQFEIVVPDGFRPFPDAVKGDYILAFRKEEGGGEIPSMILIKRLGGTLSIDNDFVKDLPIPRFTTYFDKWGDFDIPVVHVPAQANETHITTMIVQVPLAPKAIQISVVGEARRDGESKAILKSLLESLKGKSNWLTRKERIQALSEGIGFALIVLCVILAVTLNWWRNRRKRSKQPTRKRKPNRDDNDQFEWEEP